MVRVSLPPHLGRSWLAFVRVAGLGLACGVLTSCDDGTSFPADVATRIDAAIADNAFMVFSPGFTVTVVLPGRGTYLHADGYANLERLEPMEPLDRFRVGSITKTFVAATTLRLARRGVLSLDDSVALTEPSFGLPGAITYEMLLSHTSGIFNFTNDATFLNLIQEPWTPDQIVAWALDPSLTDHGYGFAPGAGYDYSNTGYQLMGLALEDLTGRPLQEVLRAETLDVVGLHATGLDRYEEPLGSYVDGYLSRKVVTGDIEPAWTWAAGGMISNGRDLCRWADALVRGDVLTDADKVTLMTPTPQSLASGIEQYGHGLRTTTRAGRTVVGHTGSTLGFRGELFFEPTTGICVSVLTNEFFSVPSAVSDAVWAVLPPE